MHRFPLVMAATGLLFTSCSEGFIPEARGATLELFDNCPDLLAYLRDESKDRVTAWGLGFHGDPMVMAGDARAAVTESNTAGSATYSTTNTQEAGVDEGDVVETDGHYLYVAATGTVQIIDVTTRKVVASLAVPDGSSQLVLDGDRLAVVTSGWGTETVVSVFDAVDPADPVLVSREHVEGTVDGVRASGGVLRLVMRSPLATRLPFVHPDQFGYDEASALAQNRRIIEQSPISEWLPRRFHEQQDGARSAVTAAIGCDAVAAPPEFAGLGITWIAAVALDDGSYAGAAGVVSDGGTVYASTDSIYVATVSWAAGPVMSDRMAMPVQAGTGETLIHKFAVTGIEATYVASGAVPGTLLNQFAMSEHNGDLRVAVTVRGLSGNSDSESSVHVLRPAGGTLVEVGAVGGLGRTEQIYAVRFLGDVGYVVTFRQTDPLYVLDLANPAAPRLAGELKIPGYSAYLHPLGDGRLIGVGQDADVDGRTLGAQLSLFDVDNPSAPRRVDALTVGGWSNAESDHHAFVYWPADGTVVIPVHGDITWGACPPNAECAPDWVSGGGGVYVAKVDGDRLVERGRVRFGGTCPDTVQRVVVIGDELVLVGTAAVVFAGRDDLAVRDTVRLSESGCQSGLDPQPMTGQSWAK